MTRTSVSNKDNAGKIAFSELCIYNYFSIKIWELVGNEEPTQNEIDLIENQLVVFARLKKRQEKAQA